MSSRQLYRMPQPFLHREVTAGERLRVGGLVEYRRDPNNRRHWKLYHPLQPGGNHQNLFVAPNGDAEYVEEGEQALTVQFFGEMVFHALLRRGEKGFGPDYERGMKRGSPLVSAGDGTGALVAASRFVNAARVAGTAEQTLDLTDAEEDQLIQIRTHIFTGAIAEAG